MKKLIIIFITLILPSVVFAQPKKLLEIDAESLAPVQTDILTGVTIDKIGLDDSKRPCARVKIRINRMTKEEMERVSVRVIGGNIALMKQSVAAEGNGIIIELTAKEQTRFYLHHEKYGDSNEVSLNLEGDKEYKLEAMLNTTHSIVVSSNLKDSDVYLDGVYKGHIGESFSLTVSDVYPGTHKIKVQQGALYDEEEVEVNSANIHFRINIDYEKAKPQFVIFQVDPKTANLVIDGENKALDEYGQFTVVLNNGQYSYSVSAQDYHDEKGTFIVEGKKVEKYIKLRPAYGWLKVGGSGKLQGASVYVDNNYIGKTPISSKQLPSGEHTVRIVQDLYLTKEEKVTIRDNETYTYSPDLIADYATVTFDCNSDCTIYINNQNKGNSPWTGDIPSGTYIIEARKEGYHTSSISKTISAHPAKQRYEIPTPTPILGSVTIQSTPAMADIYIDNQKAGRTPLNMDLIIGSHKISVRKDGYKEEVKTITIEEGSNRELSFNLSENKKVQHSSKNTSSILEKTINIRPASSSVFVYVDGSFVGSSLNPVTVKHGLRNITIWKNGSYYRKDVTIDSYTPIFLDMNDARKVSSPGTSSSTSTTPSWHQSTSSKTTKSKKTYTQPKTAREWNMFNIGIYADLACTASEDFGIGAGVNIRMARADSWVIPMAGVRYMYYKGLANVVGFPITLNINILRIINIKYWSWYMGAGIDSSFYSINYTEDDVIYKGKKWILEIPFNLIGVSTRHHDICMYLNITTGGDFSSLGFRYTYYL